jgi:predicted metal-dependent phosphoesterase TrpH
MLKNVISKSVINKKAQVEKFDKDASDKNIKRYDLHIHSYFSRCSRNRPEDILRYAKKAGLNGIAITDHHTMAAYPVLKKLNKDKNFEIIPGMEITTQYGDVIGLYLKEEIHSREFFQVIKEIKSQGGIVIIPHPYRSVPWQKFKYPLDKLKGKIDAIETFNSRNLLGTNRIAVNVAKRLNISQVGSSDGHILLDIGNGYTIFHGTLRDAIKKNRTKVGGTTAYGLFSGFSAFVNRRVFYPLLGGHAK